MQACSIEKTDRALILLTLSVINKASPMMHNSILLGWFGSTEIIIILVIVLLLFGGRKIPELMKGLGKGVKSFKDGLDNENDEPDGDAPKK